MSQLLLSPISLLLLALAAGPDASAPRERVEWIELSGDGASGVLATTPEFMKGAEAVYHFGAGPCRAHKLGKRTLDELLAAMRAGTLVKIESTRVGAGDEARACIDAVRLFAPPR